MATPVAFITGSGKKRVGYTVAQALARKGYNIAVHFNHSKEDAAETVQALRTLGVQAEAFGADLADEAAVKIMIDRIIERFARIDLLVNCAAIWERKALEEVTASDVRRHFEVNALGTYLCCQRVGLAMVKQASGGCIVNLGDWADVRPYLGYSAYFPSKGAVASITRSMAVELAERNPNIRVNAILPGPVMLPPDMPQIEKDHAIRATLLQREGRPENIAQAVLAFAENDYITGVCLPVDGGRTLSSQD